MRFKLSLLAAIPLALCAAEKPFSAPTGYFTPECLASFPQAEFRQETEAALDAVLAEKPERLRCFSPGALTRSWRCFPDISRKRRNCFRR